MKAGYRIEQLAAFAICGLLIACYLAQALVYRFTPRRRWIETKYQMLLFGTAALVVQTIRAYDLSSMYGTYSVSFQHGIHAQVTAILLDALVVMLLSTARSLYVQINRKIPAYHFWLLWMPVILYHLFSAAYAIWEGMLWRKDSPATHLRGFATVSFVKANTFNVIGIYVFVINDVLFYMLYQRVSKFARSLEAADQGRKASTTASVLPSQSHHRAPTLNAAGGLAAVDKLKITVVQPHPVHPVAGKANFGTIQGDAQNVSQDPSPAPSPTPSDGVDDAPLLTPQSNNWASNGAGSDAVDLEVLDNSGGRDTPVSRSILKPHAHLRHSSSAASPARPSLPINEAPSSRRSSGPVISAGQSAKLHVQPQPTSGDVTPPNATTPLVASPVTAHTRISITTHTRISITTSTAAATAATGSTTSTAVDSAGDRIAVLRVALRKMLLMLFFTNVVLIASIAADIPGCVDYLRHTTSLSELTAPDPDSYSIGYLLTYWLQMAALTILVWYAWTSCAVWSERSVRLERDTPFWRTVRYGLPSDANGLTNRYVAPTERKMEQSHGREQSMAHPSTHAAAAASPKSAW
jgi:hypothetical protein